MLNLHMPWAPKLDITKTIALLPPQVMREVDLIGGDMEARCSE
jgi:hypothetical protein